MSQIPRYEYQKATLVEADLLREPTEQLARWLREARDAQIVEPSAMCLSTVGHDERPSSRMVLLRGLDVQGLTFYTNYGSRKGEELAHNQAACVNFWWGLMERQVRVEGHVTKLPAETSDAYFASRPRESQLASAASPQSQVVESREYLEGLVKTLGERYPDAVPRPEEWGGYLLTPDRFEFWQGRPARLHDRLIYSLSPDGWKIERLAP